MQTNTDITQEQIYKAQRTKLKELVFQLPDAKFGGFRHMYQPYPNANLSMNAVIKMIPGKKLQMALTQVRNELLIQYMEENSRATAA